MVKPRWYHSDIMAVEPYETDKGLVPGVVCVQFALTEMWLTVPTDKIIPRVGDRASWWGYTLNDSMRLVIGECEVWDHRDDPRYNPA